SERIGPRTTPRPQRNVLPLLQALDSNRDGIIDQEEMDNATVNLEILDRNDDGELSAEEYSRPIPLPRARGRFGSARVSARGVLPAGPEGGLAHFAVVDGHLFRGARPGPLG